MAVNFVQGNYQSATFEKATFPWPSSVPISAGAVLGLPSGSGVVVALEAYTQADYDAGRSFGPAIEGGIWKLPKVASVEAFGIGDKVFIDPLVGNGVSTNSLYFFGICTKAAAAAAETVEVLLQQDQSFGSGS